jgi:hypothetical protein
MVNALLQSKSPNMNLMKTFTSTFASEDFFIDIAKIALYPSDFGSFTSEKTNSVVDYLKTFLRKLSDTVRNMQLTNVKTIITQIQTLNTLLTIRESSANILTYDNAFQHLINPDLVVTKLIQKSIDSKIDNSDDFRKTTDNIINIVHAYYEITSVSTSLTMLSNLNDSIIERNLAPFEALKNYKDIVIAAYNDLSKLQSLSKAESVSDYFIISDEKSCNSLAQTLVDYIAKGFSVYKTGFTLLDHTLEGIESASVHLFSAPSNHGKSIFCINMCRNIIEHNVSDFEKNDAVLFVTLEDLYKKSSTSVMM